jgi:probable rRNA maturation factor
MEIDCDLEDVWPADGDWPGLAERACEAVAQIAPALSHPRLSVSVLFTDDETVHGLNNEWRGKDKATNVLSFPMLERAELLALSVEGPPEMLGDIALAYETCVREAEEKGVPLAEHAAHLIVHGMLHLAGHDHETGEAEADAMEAIEIKALAIMGVADPYGGLD